MKLFNFINTNSFLLILGLVFQLIGGILVSIEALGIKEYLEYRDDGVEHHKRCAELSLNATLNNVSVFLSVNIVWYIIIRYIFNLPLKISLSIVLAGYFIWKFTIKISKLLVNFIQKLSFKMPSKAGLIVATLGFIYTLGWAILFFIAKILSMLIEFGLDIPFRYFSEKIVSKLVLYMFIKTYKILESMKNEVFKKPIFIGVLFIVLGFIYQFAGTIIPSK